MAQEIERKFLTCNDRWRGLAEGVPYRQGYLRSERGHVVRVHTMGTPVRTSGFITITSTPAALPESGYEFSIPIQDAIAMLNNLCIDSRMWEQAGITYREGFLSTEADHTIRFRIAGSRGFLTIKTKTVGLSRTEFEFEIPCDRAKELLDQVCEQPQIEKIRYRIPQGDVIWEVDEFLAGNQGLILAEVELQDEAQQVVLPDWIGTEVSGDRRYYNSYLVKNPFTQW